MTTVGIICPTSIEYQSCSDSLSLTDEEEIQGRRISKGSEQNIQITAVQAGPGKIQSASATQLIIDRFEPDILYDVGGAGALSPEINIFDIICCEYVYEFDVCPIADFQNQKDDLTVSTLLPDLPKKEKEILHQFVELIQSKKAINLRIGNIVSGEKNVNESALREKLHSSFQAIACNWESSAILKTAKINGTKAMSFRVITDKADEDMTRELEANWTKALETLYAVLEEFLFKGWLLNMLNCF